MPELRSSRRGRTSRRTARIPQWASLTLVLEEPVEQPREHRVADVLMKPRHRAGLIPSIRSPSTRSAAALELLDESGSSRAS